MKYPAPGGSARLGFGGGAHMAAQFGASRRFSRERPIGRGIYRLGSRGMAECRSRRRFTAWSWRHLLAHARRASRPDTRTATHQTIGLKVSPGGHRPKISGTRFGTEPTTTPRRHAARTGTSLRQKTHTQWAELGEYAELAGGKLTEEGGRHARHHEIHRRRPPVGR